MGHKLYSQILRVKPLLLYVLKDEVLSEENVINTACFIIVSVIFFSCGTGR